MSGINHFLLKFLILAVMLLGLPLLGVWVAGYPVARYLEFPPQTRYVTHAPFSWLAFTVIALSILAVVLPLAVKGFQSFEMPLLGYAGYLPFGLECAVIGSMVSKLLGRDSG